MHHKISKWKMAHLGVLIHCGDKDRIASERERWNDESNTLCIQPGIDYNTLIRSITGEGDYIHIKHEKKRRIKKWQLISEEEII